MHGYSSASRANGVHAHGAGCIHRESARERENFGRERDRRDCSPPGRERESHLQLFSPAYYSHCCYFRNKWRGARDARRPEEHSCIRTWRYPCFRSPLIITCAWGRSGVWGSRLRPSELSLLCFFFKTSIFWAFRFEKTIIKYTQKLNVINSTSQNQQRQKHLV